MGNLRVLWKVGWMVFCWGKHARECFDKVDTGVKGRLVKKWFAEADTGERLFR